MANYSFRRSCEIDPRVGLDYIGIHKDIKYNGVSLTFEKREAYKLLFEDADFVGDIPNPNSFSEQSKNIVGNSLIVLDFKPPEDLQPAVNNQAAIKLTYPKATRYIFDNQNVNITFGYLKNFVTKENNVQALDGRNVYSNIFKTFSPSKRLTPNKVPTQIRIEAKGTADRKKGFACLVLKDLLIDVRCRNCTKELEAVLSVPLSPLKIVNDEVNILIINYGQFEYVWSFSYTIASEINPANQALSFGIPEEFNSFIQRLQADALNSQLEENFEIPTENGYSFTGKGPDIMIDNSMDQVFEVLYTFIEKRVESIEKNIVRLAASKLDWNIEDGDRYTFCLQGISEGEVSICSSFKTSDQTGFSYNTLAENNATITAGQKEFTSRTKVSPGTR